MTSTKARPDASTPPPIDPRIRARRIEVARDTGRRRLRRLAKVVGAVAVLAALWGLALSPLLDVDAVEVAGAARTDRTDLLAAAGISAGEAMVALDLDEAERAVAGLPWVAEARAVRSWPGTVRLAVEEWEPAGALPLGGGRGWVLVSATGHLLERVGALPEGTVVVEGVEHDGEPGARAADAEAPLRAVLAAPEALRPRLRRVRAGAGGELHLVVALDGEATVTARLGPPDDLPAKLVAVATVLEQADLADVSAVDVRVPDSPVLTRGGARG